MRSNFCVYDLPFQGLERAELEEKEATFMGDVCVRLF